MTDHRGDPADGIDSVGGSAVPVGRRPAELAGDPRLDPLFPNHEPRQRVPAVAISGQIPVVRVAVGTEAPPPSTNGGAARDSATIVPPAPAERDTGPDRRDADASIGTDVRPTQQVTLAPPDERPPVPSPPAPPARVDRRARAARPQPTPERRPAVVRRSKPRVRRVRRVVRSVDTWTVFKVSALFYLVAYIIVLVAGVLLWNLANSTGTVDNIERFFESFGWDSFEFKGGEIYHAYWIIGLFLVVAGTGFNVTLAVLFNLIADLVGGVGVTVLEEEVRVVRVEDHPERAGPDEPFDADVWNDSTGSTYRPDAN